MIIGFLGRKRSGKDTAANYFIKNHNFLRYAFGDPVKEVARAMFNFNDEQLYGSLKEELDSEWNISPRKAFQVIGTDFAQYSIYKSIPELIEKVPMRHFWVKRFESWYKKEIEKDKNTCVVISDVRFQHEIDAIKKLNGKVIKILSNRQESDSHLSENEIDKISEKQIDYCIENNDTIDNFHFKLKDIYKQINTST
tara:strand:- start:56 stop:643 length:588 start_codon:yes stop_codon:yes gene_type:complete